MLHIQKGDIFNRIDFKFQKGTTLLKESGARFTIDLKPKIFVSSIQIVWNLLKS